MFLEKVFSGKNDFGRWLAFIIIVIVAFQVIGFAPLGSLMFMNLNDNPDLTPDPENILDFTSYGISIVSGLALALIPFITGLIAIVVLIKPVHERPVISLFSGKETFRWNRFIYGLILWLLMLTVLNGVMIAIGILKVEFQWQPQSFNSLILVSLLLFPFQAGFQEVFFRGYLMQGFSAIFLKRWVPVLITALLFALFQYVNPLNRIFGQSVAFSSFIIFGIFLGVCVLFDDGLEMALGIHFINNTFYSLFFTRESNAILTPALFNIKKDSLLIDFTGLLIISLIFYFFAGKKYSWPGWAYLFTKIEKPILTEDLEYSQELGFLGEYDEEEDEN